MLKIHPVPAFSDNYLWVIENSKTRAAAVVDPGDAAPVLDFLRAHELRLSCILVTHQHNDHIGGIKKLLEVTPVVVYGPENISLVTHAVREGDSVEIFPGSVLKVLEVPGHTLNHLAYYCQDNLFCGDTLFSAGCGRMFEGEPEQFLHSLKKIKALPEDTKLYPAHEYTLANLCFSKEIEPGNSDIFDYEKQVKEARKQEKPSLPTILAIEKRVNPFLRTDNLDVWRKAQELVGRVLYEEADVFAVLRKVKDNF